MKLNGHDASITSNLFRALKQVHHILKHQTISDAQPTAIWVDQLCINQQDSNEQSSQVATMGEIYAKAEFVLVSLGDSFTAAHATEAVNTLQPHISASLKVHQAFDDMPLLSADDLKRWNLLDWKSVREMLSSTWFRRAWVVQEVALSRRAKVMYGDCHFEWHALTNVLGWLCHPASRLYHIHGLSGWTFYQLWVSFDMDNRSLIRTFRPFNFLDVLGYSASSFNTTDQRDHIYAFLGHPSLRLHGSDESLQSLVIRPDYALASQQVYLDFAITWLAWSHRSFLLSCVNHRSLPLPCEDHSTSRGICLDLPSWCPRWDYMPLGGTRFSTERESWGFRSSGITTFRYELSSANELKLRGFPFDTIACTFQTFAELPDPLEVGTDELKLSHKEFRTISKLGYLGYSILEWRKTSPIGHLDRDEDAMTAFATTIASEYWTAEEAPFARRQQLAKFMICAREALALHSDTTDTLVLPFRAALSVVTQSCETSEYGLTTSQAVTILRAAETITAPRRVYVTSRGHIGLGPDIVTPGDICCIVSGAEVPYILRPCESSTFFLVGEGYLDGVMDGEAVSSLGENDSCWKTLVIR
jgi:hypothetical protein